MHTNCLLKKTVLLFSIVFQVLILHSQAPQLAWAQSIGNAGVSDASVLTLDDSGNSYMAGSYGTGGITFGSITLSGSGSSENGFIVKFDAQGNALWAKRVRRVGGFQDSTNPDRIAVDSAGNVYVCGLYLNGAMMTLLYFRGIMVIF